MTITVSGSMKHATKMEALKVKLEALGHLVHLPEMSEAGLKGEKLRARKPMLIQDHTEKIKKSDALLVANYPKNDIDGYIGGNTFLEMGMAYMVGKPIYLISPIPELAYTDEIYGLEPIILYGKLDGIRRT